MSTYTMLLKTFIEQSSQYETGLTTAERIEKGRVKLFDFDYPIFDDAYRKAFETKFIRQFYMREIGFETEGRFKFELENWLNLNMGYFNQLYESELIEFDPMRNSEVDVTNNRTTNRTQNDTANSTQNVTGNGTTDTTNTVDDFQRDLQSKPPDKRLALTTNDGEGVIEYASEIKEQNHNGTNTQNVSGNNEQDTTSNGTLDSNINDVEDFIQHRAGKIGIQTYSKMLMEYRQSFIRIERELFDEMNELFMLVY